MSVLRLEDVLKQNLPQNQALHFCKIDIEGFEKECLLGINFKQNRPWLFCIESTLPETGIASYQEWEYILLGQDYELIFANGVNRYYADKTCQAFKTIKNNIETADNFKDYDIFVHSTFEKKLPRTTIEKIKWVFSYIFRFVILRFK